MKNRGYKVFADGSTNLIGIRSKNREPNSFDDMLYDIRITDDVLSQRAYLITTDPGTPNLLKPQNPNGCAILKPGQYRGMWAVGLHKGKYSALVQVGNCTVIRDADLDNELDCDAVAEETGLFGINCHKAKDGVVSTVVDSWSAGCQVFADASLFDMEFMPEMQKVAEKYGNRFTYTLLDESDFL